ncbi:RAN GTPase-activating protein 1 [Durusdinium trenchii]|uniref:RAN GTPase-activating protein 1 n=1 Tax=Durusdinium trenchii TaxID=1381693 RepID=A0ABP0I642_9DINO
MSKALHANAAKALAQSLLGNAQTVLQTVRTTVDLSKRGLDDDDFVFLEEWLRRYDCVTDLNLSWNFMSRDGIRKLTRHIKESKVLTKLNCVGLPVTLEGSALLARAVVENHTLRQVALPLGHCHDTTERQQMIQQFGMGLASHPTLHSFACTRTPNLEYAREAQGKAITASTSDPVIEK